MIDYEYYDWTSLLTPDARFEMCKGIMELIQNGSYWKNSPPYQTNVNVMGLPGEHWTNLKMSFIWSCFAYMKHDRPIKTIKSWAYKTSMDTQKDRHNLWHQHVRDQNLVLSGVYYLRLPDGLNFIEESGTELAQDKPEGLTEYCPAKLGYWLIFPGKTWHRPGVLNSKDWRYIVAADMEL